MWQQDNTLTKAELRKKLRDKNVQVLCTNGCKNTATDVHHLDGNHHNDESTNLAPACKLCHNEVHGITADMTDLKLVTRLFYEAQDQRKAAKNRVKAYKALGIDVPMAEQALNDAKEYEKHVKKHVESLVKKQPLYNRWLKDIYGIGPLLAANLISEIGSPDRFDSPRNIWAYCGLHVNSDGTAPKRTKNATANWNHNLKVVVWKVVDCFVKKRKSFGRQLYDNHKEYYQSKDGDLTKMHIENRTRRKVAKDFVRCLWAEWREMLDLPMPQAQAGTWPMPNDWIQN